MFNGISIQTCENETLTVKVIVLNCTFDLPARCSAYEMISFNGEYGCCWCLHKGEKQSTWCYPLNKKPEFQIRMRSEPGIQEAYKLVANHSTKNQFGIQGVPVFTQVTNWTMLSRTTLDAMHGVYLGVTKTLLNLWFKSNNHTQAWYITKENWRRMFLVVILFIFYYLEIDGHLAKIKLPNCFHANVRSITNHLGYFKAHEYRTFLMYLFEPVFSCFVKTKPDWKHVSY